MKRTLCLYLTPIVLVIWALFIAITGSDNQPIRLVTIATSMGIQIHALYCKYRELDGNGKS